MLAKNGGIFSPISRLFLRTNNYDLFHIKPFINVGDGAFSSEGSSLKRLIIKQHRNNEFIWSEEVGLAPSFQDTGEASSVRRVVGGFFIQGT